MNLVYLYYERGIEGYPTGQLLNILNGQDIVKVKMSTNGMVLLDNNKMIKCVSNYYMTPSGAFAKKSKMSNDCYYTQKDLGITGVGNYKCLQCHTNCINMFNDGFLNRKR
jgi:hypothetical protein